MAAPLSPDHTFMVLEAGRTLDDRQADNFYDHVAHELSNIDDPSTRDVKQAIVAARLAVCGTRR